nr:hypothetical protein [Ruegeria atlantica]
MLRKHLENCRVQYENDPDSTVWLVIARGLIDSLRQTWETAIEDAVSPVLRTFSSKVDTKGFAKLSAITEADATTSIIALNSKMRMTSAIALSITKAERRLCVLHLTPH